MAGLTVSQMLNGRANSGTGPIPTQTFYASNIAGTTIPRVGPAQSSQTASNAGGFAGVKPSHLALIVVILIGAGYLIHHLSFEESARVGG